MNTYMITIYEADSVGLQGSYTVLMQTDWDYKDTENFVKASIGKETRAGRIESIRVHYVEPLNEQEFEDYIGRL